MTHHLHPKAYAPGRKMRSDKYRHISEEGHHKVAGLGLEWVIPSIFLVIITALGEWAIGLTWAEILLSEIILISYSIFLFGYLHDRMHVRDIWLLKNSVLRKWFLRARRNHDIHHNCITDSGLMKANFGIAFSFYDHIFGTYQSRLKRLNRKGVEAAYERYDISPEEH